MTEYDVGIELGATITRWWAMSCMRNEDEISDLDPGNIATIRQHLGRYLGLITFKASIGYAARHVRVSFIS